MLDIEKINNIPFFFIVARGRSGTTLLQNILDANENIIIPTESRLIIHLKNKYHNTKNWTPSLLSNFADDLYLDKKFATYWQISKDELTQTLNSLPLEKVTFKLLCKIIYLNYNSPYDKSKIIMLGDKNPTYSIFIQELREIFPEAKFIHLIRNYRDNILSNTKTFNAETLPVASYGWLSYNSNILKETKKQPNLFLLVKYEELVSTPEEIIRKICSFLSIPFNEKMLHFNKEFRSFVQNENINIQNELSDIHPNITSPINTKQINKWRDKLSLKEVELIEYIAGDLGEKLGYKRTVIQKHSFSKSFIAFKSKMHQIFNITIIKFYYTLPFSFRVFLSKTSAYLFKKFNYTNYFNSADFRYNENPKE